MFRSSEVRTFYTLNNIGRPQMTHNDAPAISRFEFSKNNMFLIMFLISKTFDINYFIWNQWVISEIRVWLFLHSRPVFCMNHFFTIFDIFEVQKGPLTVVMSSF